MKFVYEKEKRELTVILQGEIDNVVCKNIRPTIDANIIKYEPLICMLDFKNVDFIDSSAIGLVLGRYNLLNMLNSKIKVVNLKGTFIKMFKLSKVDKYISVEEAAFNEK